MEFISPTHKWLVKFYLQLPTSKNYLYQTPHVIIYQMKRFYILLLLLILIRMDIGILGQRDHGQNLLLVII